jgi:hypothetical protein
LASAFRGTVLAPLPRPPLLTVFFVDFLDLAALLTGAFSAGFSSEDAAAEASIGGSGDFFAAVREGFRRDLWAVIRAGFRARFAVGFAVGASSGFAAGLSTGLSTGVSTGLSTGFVSALSTGLSGEAPEAFSSTGFATEGSAGFREFPREDLLPDLREERRAGPCR